MPVHSAIRSQTYIRIPHKQTLGRAKRLSRALLGGVLSPIYWLLAYRYRVPGLKFRKECALLAFRLFIKRMFNKEKMYISFAKIYRLLFWPLDSVRYFEFDFVWHGLSDLSIRHYLDVSSPHLLPIMLVLKKNQLRAELMNPDVQDLITTANLSKALGFEKRCNFHPCLISAATFEPGSFDVVTSMSVLEHIPEDNEAIRKMWEFLEPGGRLLLTVPCASGAREEYIDRNEYGLLEPDKDGFFFFQRYYDRKLLSENVFSITGEPLRYAVYGEKTAGAYHRNEQSKLSDPNYPAWREPYTMGQEYRYFDSVDDLPGIGVIGMEFVKT